MIALVAGLILFIAPHLFRETGARARLLRRLPSESAYKGLFTLLVASGLILIAWGKSNAEFTMIWQPPFQYQHFSFWLMAPACVLLMAGNLPQSLVKRELRNPMLLGVVLWSMAHLWTNGDLASVTLFGALGLWALVKYISLWRLQPIEGEFKAGWLLWDALALLGGFLLFATLVLWHGELFGVGLNVDY